MCSKEHSEQIDRERRLNTESLQRHNHQQSLSPDLGLSRLLCDDRPHVSSLGYHLEVELDSAVSADLPTQTPHLDHIRSELSLGEGLAHQHLARLCLLQSLERRVDDQAEIVVPERINVFQLQYFMDRWWHRLLDPQK